jgi:toxin YoeB
MNKIFTGKSWEDYLYWQSRDKKTLKKINDLLKDIERNDNAGVSKNRTA